MPVLEDHIIVMKWSNPTEVVKVNPEDGTSKTVFLEDTARVGSNTRGGSQIIPWRDYYIAVTHDVDLFKSETGRKDAVYTHRFLFWDKISILLKQQIGSLSWEDMLSSALDCTTRQ